MILRGLRARGKASPGCHQATERFSVSRQTLQANHEYCTTYISYSLGEAGRLSGGRSRIWFQTNSRELRTDESSTSPASRRRVRTLPPLHRPRLVILGSIMIMAWERLHEEETTLLTVAGSGITPGWLAGTPSLAGEMLTDAGPCAPDPPSPRDSARAAGTMSVHSHTQGEQKKEVQK